LEEVNKLNNNRINSQNIAVGIFGFIVGAMGTATLVLANKDFRKDAIRKTNRMLSNMRIWSDKIIEIWGKQNPQEINRGKEYLAEEI
jgi:hypothetical protein